MTNNKQILVHFFVTMQSIEMRMEDMGATKCKNIESVLDRNRIVTNRTAIEKMTLRYWKIVVSPCRVHVFTSLPDVLILLQLNKNTGRVQRRFNEESSMA
jgi:hypothetical protein